MIALFYKPNHLSLGPSLGRKVPITQLFHLTLTVAKKTGQPLDAPFYPSSKARPPSSVTSTGEVTGIPEPRMQTLTFLKKSHISGCIMASLTDALGIQACCNKSSDFGR